MSEKWGLEKVIQVSQCKIYSSPLLKSDESKKFENVLRRRERSQISKPIPYWKGLKIMARCFLNSAL